MAWRQMPYPAAKSIYWRRLECGLDDPGMGEQCGQLVDDETDIDRKRHAVVVDGDGVAVALGP
jgi:hypothetical protein